MAFPTVQQMDAKSPVNENLMLNSVRPYLGGSFAGQIAPWYDYNGALSVPVGFMYCNGDIINETNYDAIHGAGAWDIDVVSTSLDGKYTPNIQDDMYLVGGSSTQAGGSAITTVGNTDHQVDFSHVHTGPSHTHKWYEALAASLHDQTYNSSGVVTNLSPGVNKDSGKYFISLDTGTVGSETAITDSYVKADGTGNTGSAGSATQSIKPEAIACKYLIKIV